jgi:hypothetical protein
MFPPLLAPFRGWRAALLLVAAACATPGRAAAECGDHVVILNGPHARANPGHAAPPAADESPAPARPCSGPNCSRRSGHHPAPPAPVPNTGPGGKEVAPILGAVEPPDGASARFDDCTSPRPIRRASTVFHPPRFG